MHFARYFRLTILLAFLSACSQATERKPGAIEVSEPWVRYTLPERPLTAGYLTLSNRAAVDAVLVSVGSPDFGDVSLHESYVEQGMSRMREIVELKIPAGGDAVLTPGGYHLMLADPTHKLELDTKVVLELQFANGETLRTDALVRRD